MAPRCECGSVMYFPPDANQFRLYRLRNPDCLILSYRASEHTIVAGLSPKPQMQV